MLRLKSRTQCPVAGFQFIDAPISAAPLKTWDFEELVRSVQAQRQANPRFNLPTDPDAIRAEVDLQNAQRMISIKGAESYISREEAGAPNFPKPRGVQGRDAAGRVVRLAAGTLIIRDWLGDGMQPVAPTLSNARALCCVNCSKNVDGDFWQRIEAAAADRLRKLAEVATHLQLRTAVDDRLFSCQACDCWNPLKVHVPLAHIQAHTDDATRSRLWPQCWILQEEKQT